MSVEAAAKPRATRKPKVTPEEKANAAHAAQDIITALEWIDVAQRDDASRPIYEQHCQITQGWIMAYDGVITAGHTIEQDGEFSPNTAKLLSALIKSGDGLAMTYDGARSVLQVKSKKFKVDVPCAAAAGLAIPYPEPAGWEVSDALLIALKIALQITKQAPDVLTSSVMVTANNTIMATDRHLFLEVAHGCPMYECIIPRHFAKIAAAKEGLTHVGMTATSVTFWYGPSKFIRTQLYERDTWPPDPSMIFAGATHVGSEVPKDFATAVDAVMPHSALGDVWCDGKTVMSAPIASEAAAIHECKGCPTGIAFAGKDLAKALKLAATIEHVDAAGLFFYGEGFRGKVTARTASGEHLGSDQPPADHRAFDAPPGFVLPGVHDPIASALPPTPSISPAEAYAIDSNPYAD